MDDAAIDRASSALAEGRLRRVRLGPLPPRIRPADESDAYRLQAAVRARLTAGGYGEPAGRKIGCTTPVMQEFLGIPNPCAGLVYVPTVRHGSGEFDHASFLHPGVECEIAVRLGEALPERRRPYDRASVEGAVESVMAGIEVVDDRWSDYRSIDAATLIADDFFGAGCVLGEAVTRWRDLDLAAVRGRMTINGVDAGDGAGGDIMGHPLEALAWLANSALRHGNPLRAGEFVLLGSVVETRWVGRGDLVEIEVAGLGAASARFI